MKFTRSSPPRTSPLLTIHGAKAAVERVGRRRRRQRDGNSAIRQASTRERGGAANVTVQRIDGDDGAVSVQFAATRQGHRGSDVPHHGTFPGTATRERARRSGHRPTARREQRDGAAGAVNDTAARDRPHSQKAGLQISATTTLGNRRRRPATQANGAVHPTVAIGGPRNHGTASAQRNAQRRRLVEC